MVYLAELLVVMTEQLKIVRILVRNVTRTRTQALRQRRVSRISLSLQEGDVFACSMRQGAIMLKHKKIVSGQLVHVWQWPLNKKIVMTVCSLHYDTKSEQSDCNKSSVR